MNYTLRSKQELYDAWAELRTKEAALKDYLNAELVDIAADKKIIELELQLLCSVGIK